MLLFVPSTFLVAGISAWAIGVGLARPGLPVRLLRDVGLTAAAAFLLVNLVMEAAGWIVGGPNAAARATMLTVMLTGITGAALAGGAVLGDRQVRPLIEPRGLGRELLRWSVAALRRRGAARRDAAGHPARTNGPRGMTQGPSRPRARPRRLGGAARPWLRCTGDLQ